MTPLSWHLWLPSPESIPGGQKSFSMGPILGFMTLTRAPLQPLQLAAPKFLAWKAFFLTLLASGARRGELHVITAKSVQHDDKWKSVSLFPHPGFISKTKIRAKGARSLQKLIIPALLPRLGPDMSENCSPYLVQALQIYLAKTEDKRMNKELLFISYKDATKETFTRILSLGGSGS